jgi:protein-disulfide isomerase
LPELLRLKATLGNDLRWVFRHRPLSQHPDAESAARLLAAVGSELGAGVFWKLVTELSRDRESEPKDVFDGWFARSGLDGALRSRLEASTTAEAIVKRDSELGARLLVRATPTLFVNGIRLEGFFPEEPLLELVKKERRGAVFALLAGTEASALYPERTLRNLVNLGEDPKERACLPSGGAPSRGPADAPVSIVEFCAFESSYCQKAEPALAALVSRYPREVRVVWKSFPIALDGEGRAAANFALAAREAGGDAAFFGVHGALFEARAVLDEPRLVQAVQKLGLDHERLLSSARSGAQDASIDADVALGKRLGVSGVPTYFINGLRKDGLLTLPELEQAVRAELGLDQRLRAIGRGHIEEQVCAALGRSR